MSEQLTDKGIQVHIVTKNQSDDLSVPGIRVATMHRVKGIEFDHIVLAPMEEENWPTVEVDLPVESRCLIHVAATRARKSVLVTSAGEMVSRCKGDSK